MAGPALLPLARVFDWSPLWLSTWGMLLATLYCSLLLFVDSPTQVSSEGTASESPRLS
jgi:hypothetical protein